MDVVTYALLKNMLDTAIGSLTPGYTYMGSVNDVSDLPSSANSGDLYIVKNDGNAQYVWDGTEWLKLDNDAITAAQIDALFE